MPVETGKLQPGKTVFIGKAVIKPTKDSLILRQPVDNQHLMSHVLQFTLQRVALQYRSVVLRPVKCQDSYSHVPIIL